MADISIERISLRNAEERKEIVDFLSGYDLALDSDVDYTLAARQGAVLVGTASKAGSVLKCIAVSPGLQGEGLSADLVTALINRLFEEGIHHYFVFTMPGKTGIFENLGFHRLYQGSKASLLEGGTTDIRRRLTRLRDTLPLPKVSGRSALVMNCNPFTLGHRHLVEQALKDSHDVLLFVVEEDRSIFRFEERLELVRQGTADLPGVTVLPGTEYIISNATFPSYFLREPGTRTEAFMELDAGIFCRYFAPIFGIETRFVGDEPFCDVTACYNGVLRNVFNSHGLKLVEVPRLEKSGEAVSASRVRQLIREDCPEAVKELVPETTWNYLYESPKGKEAVERVKGSDAPH